MQSKAPLSLLLTILVSGCGAPLPQEGDEPNQSGTESRETIVLPAWGLTPRSASEHGIFPEGNLFGYNNHNGKAVIAYSNSTRIDSVDTDAGVFDVSVASREDSLVSMVWVEDGGNELIPGHPLFFSWADAWHEIDVPPRFPPMLDVVDFDISEGQPVLLATGARQMHLVVVLGDEWVVEPIPVLSASVFSRIWIEGTTQFVLGIGHDGNMILLKRDVGEGGLGNLWAIQPLTSDPPGIPVYGGGFLAFDAATKSLSAAWNRYQLPSVASIENRDWFLSIPRGAEFDRISLPRAGDVVSYAVANGTHWVVVDSRGTEQHLLAFSTQWKECGLLSVSDPIRLTQYPNGVALTKQPGLEPGFIMPLDPHSCPAKIP